MLIFFKKVNDHYGHPIGDKALTLVADALKSTVRDHDMIGRLGGEEFGILLTHVTLEDAHYIADRIRRSVANTYFVHLGQHISLTVSVGGVVFLGDAEYSTIYKAADANLYEAKQTGRNRSVITQIPSVHPSTQGAFFARKKQWPIKVAP